MKDKPHRLILLVQNPVATGEGMAIFDEIDIRRDFELVKSESFRIHCELLYSQKEVSYEFKDIRQF